MIRVNIKAKVNNAEIRSEQRNGRAVIVVPSTTLPDNVVMNGIMYPAEEIDASFRTLNRTPAPLGHPMIGNQFIGAREPEAINEFWVGAWNENVRREGGRVHIDKVIDIEAAARTVNGQRMLDAINKRDPIHTSTGVWMEVEPVPNNEQFDGIARNMQFDHDAILLDEAGAATPEMGVGIFVNAEGEREEVDAVSVSVPDDEIETAAGFLVEAAERHEKRGKMNDMKRKVAQMMRNLLNSDPDDQGTSLQGNNEGGDMSVSKEEFEALSQKVEGFGEQITAALEPVVNSLAEIAQEKVDREEAEKAELVQRVVNVGLLDEDDAKELTLNALRKLSERAKPASAAPLLGQFAGNTDDDEWAGYELNANIDAAQGGK